MAIKTNEAYSHYTAHALLALQWGNITRSSAVVVIADRIAYVVQEAYSYRPLSWSRSPCDV